MVDTDPGVTQLEKEKDPFVLFLKIALSLIVVIIVAVTWRYCMNKKSLETVEAENRAKRAKDFKADRGVEI